MPAWWSTPWATTVFWAQRDISGGAQFRCSSSDPFCFMPSLPSLLDVDWNCKKTVTPAVQAASMLLLPASQQLANVSYVTAVPATTGAQDSLQALFRRAFCIADWLSPPGLTCQSGKSFQSGAAGCHCRRRCAICMNG
jgi:hypothetical protein